MVKSSKVEHFLFLVAILIHTILNCLESYSEKLRKKMTPPFLFYFKYWMPHCHNESRRHSKMSWHGTLWSVTSWRRDKMRMIMEWQMTWSWKGTQEVCFNHLLKTKLILKLISASKSDQVAQMPNEVLIIDVNGDWIVWFLWVNYSRYVILFPLRSIGMELICDRVGSVWIWGKGYLPEGCRHGTGS